MIMSLFKKRRYYFTDSSFASDTIIADCMGGIALIIEVVSVIVSIATAGHVPEVFGLLYIIAMLLSIVGEIFARMGLQSQKGGVCGKRISIWLNIVSFVVPVIIILLGRF
mgnify:FL=1